MQFEIFLKWFLYTTLCFIADALDDLLTLISPASIPEISLESDSPIDKFSDDEILDMFKNASHRFGRSNAFKLNNMNVILKVSVDDDQANLREEVVHNILFEKSTIPVPRFRRIIPYESYGFLCAFDYIPGQSLDKIWTSLSLWHKLRIIFTLRSYIRQLHSIHASPHTPPGGPTNSDPKESVSHLWGHRSEQGPFESYQAFLDYIEGQVNRDADRRNLPLDSPFRQTPFDISQPLVLTHNDLHLGNFILANDGRLWITDWAYAGYHPIWFDFVGMTLRVDRDQEDPLWVNTMPFIAGPYLKEKGWMYKRLRLFSYSVRLNK